MAECRGHHGAKFDVVERRGYLGAAAHVAPQALHGVDGAAKQRAVLGDGPGEYAVAHQGAGHDESAVRVALPVVEQGVPHQRWLGVGHHLKAARS